MYQDLAQWKSTWSRAVALAWRDEGFKTELLGDARSALKSRFQYDVPANLDLKVVEAGHGQGDGELTLPPAPASAEVQALHLTTLDDTLSANPLCCLC